MSSGGLIWYYGGFEHPAGEVYPQKIEIRPLPNQSGVRWASVYRFSVAGSFVNQNPELDAAGVEARIVELDVAYQHDYKDCGFKLSDGTPTNHRMASNDALNLSGNKIVYRSWDNVFPTEFANTRSFSLTVEAKFLESYDEILYFSEETTKIGTGGPMWRKYNLWDGTPVTETIANSTKVHYITSGTIIGRTTWPAMPAPLWPDDEKRWLRRDKQISPQFHGDLTFTKGTHYRRDYTQFFELNAADLTTPNPWFP